MDMFSTVLNIFRNFNSKKRRNSDAENERPAKIVKYHSAFETPDLVPDMATKKNDAQLEIEVLEETKPVKWIAPRSSIRPKTNDEVDIMITSTPNPIPSTSQAPQSRLRRSEPSQDVQVLGSYRSTPIERGKLAKRSMSSKIFGIKQPPSRISKLKPFNTISNQRCLEEKMTYKRLLEMQKNSSKPSFTFGDFKPKTSVPKKQVEEIDVEAEFNSMRVNRTAESAPTTTSSRVLRHLSNEVITLDQPSVSVLPNQKPMKPINSLQEYLKNYVSFKDDHDVKQIIANHEVNFTEKLRLASLEEAKLAALTEHNEKTSSDALEERIRNYMRISEPPIRDLEEEKYVLPTLTDDQERLISKALKLSQTQVLNKKFGLQITGQTINTLNKLNWLNDDVFNFYMELIMQRANQNESLPRVYAFNTFFYQNMVSGKYSILRRWTRKVKLFSNDMVLVPVHLGMHWCMSVIDFRTKEVRYYDSMGAENNACLDGLLAYLQAESLDKLKETFDTSGWKKINMGDIPQQMNGSDCGVFACMFAEHLSRNSPILFSQDNMPYFRRKMILELVEGALIT